MLLEFLVAGTIGFWLAIIAAIVLMAVFVAQDEFPQTTITLIAALAIFTLFSNVNPFLWVWEHAFQIPLIVVVYFALGTGWSVVKWWFHCLRVREFYDQYRKEWFKNNEFATTVTLTDEQRESLRHYVAANVARRIGYYGDIPPAVSRNKSRIIGWIIYWPFSALGTLINEPVRRLATLIYNYFSNTYTRIQQHIFKGYEELKS